MFRINALEDNAILFEFVENSRFERAKVNIPISKDHWYAIRIIVEENLVSCQVNNVTACNFQAEKPLHGHVGLWTKADSVTLFRDLVIDDGGNRYNVTC